MTNWLYQKTIAPKSPVVLTDHYLKESNVRGGNDIIIQGVISRETLENLGYDAYQRELGTQTQRGKIFSALKRNKPLPPIELGMRGSRTRDTKDGLSLNDSVYVIDGRQRVGTLVEWLAATPEDEQAFISCTVYLNTDFEWEKNRFNELNLGQRPVAPSKLFANDRKEHSGIAGVYGLCNNDKTFALFNRVSWDQNMKREDLQTARNVLIVAAHLHSHMVPSRSYTNEAIKRGLGHIVKTFGVQRLKDNLHMFFELVDECWGIRNVQYRGGMVQLKAGFLMALARMLSDHYDFWTEGGHRLNITAGDRSRLRGLTLDQNVVNLVGGGSKQRTALRWHMIQAVNHRRKGKIRERQEVASRDIDVEVA